MITRLPVSHKWIGEWTPVRNLSPEWTGDRRADLSHNPNLNLPVNLKEEMMEGTMEETGVVGTAADAAQNKSRIAMKNRRLPEEAAFFLSKNL